MRSVSPTSWILPVAITVLALADGILHFSLDIILFRGNFFGRFGPPPGAPAGNAPAAPPRAPPSPPPVPMPLPLNQMFVLNILGYVILVAVFWLFPRLLGRWRWLIDVVMIVYVAVVFLAWFEVGRPNPMGLGYLSKSIEILLIIALIAHARMTGRSSDVEAQSVIRQA